MTGCRVCGTRPTKGRGLCSACYQRVRKNKQLHLWPDPRYEEADRKRKDAEWTAMAVGDQAKAILSALPREPEGVVARRRHELDTAGRRKLTGGTT